MNIFIAKDYDGNPIAVILADDAEKAAIAFMGMDIKMHSCEEIDPTDKNLGMHGVAFLLTSIEKTNYSGSSLPTTYRKWKRGL